MSTTNKRPTPETITLISQSDLMDVIIQLFRERDEAKAYAERCRDGCISLSHSIDRIDYACGEPNEMGVSEYCVHQNDEAVVARVKGMRETLRNAEAELSVATAERDRLEDYDRMREQLEAMRSAIKDAAKAFEFISSNWTTRNLKPSETIRQVFHDEKIAEAKEALAKLQPFLKP